MFKSDKEGYKAWYGEMKDLITEGRWADSLEKLTPSPLTGTATFTTTSRTTATG